jgi:hypothetical protein
MSQKQLKMIISCVVVFVFLNFSGGKIINLNNFLLIRNFLFTLNEINKSVKKIIQVRATFMRYIR